MSAEQAIVRGRFLRMETSIQYREYAKECDRLAEETKEPRHKEVLREMAQTWRNLADQEEREKAR